MGFHKFVNTQYFREAALDFVKNHGQYTRAPRGTREYREYWDLQEFRCANGYKVGDLWIPGRHYFQLNFCPMWKVPDAAKHIQMASKKGKSSMGTITKAIQLPSFWEIDYDWWNYKYIAWKGGEYEGTTSPGGQHIACLKTRQCGFSYKEAADGIYNYTFYPGSKSFYYASKEDFLVDGSGILNKVQMGLDWINTYCPEWKQSRMKHNTLMHFKASYLDKTGMERGTMSEIVGTIVNDPNKVRGKSGVKIAFEEAGSFKNLKAALEIAMPSVHAGGFTTGQISVFGCVCAGTEIYNAKGELVLIEDLKQEDGILGYDGTTYSKEPIIWMQPPAEKECVEITLETGIKLRCSTDHPILSTNTTLKAKQRESGLQNRRVLFKEAGQLTTQDMVAVIEEMPFFGTVHNDYAYTSGQLLGDGYYCSSIELIVDNEESFLVLQEENGVENIKVKRVHNEAVTSYNLGGGVRQLLKSNGMFGQSKQVKRLPIDWEQYDRESLAKLLAGYFDADGNTKKDKSRGISVIFTSVVKELLKEVQRALLKFGIHGNLMQELSKGGYTQQHTVYRLYITRAESVENFKKHIPIQHPKKQIPAQSKRMNKMLKDAEFIKTEAYAHNKHLKPLTGALLYRVVKVEPIGKQLIYNLTAGNTHTYLANNIITHNTGGEDGPGIEGLEDIFNNPRAYNMLTLKNKWEEGYEETECGFFVPCYMANDLFIDEQGNTDTKGALVYDEEVREARKNSGDPKALDRRCAEFPRTPSEALMRMNNIIFPVLKIRAREMYLEKNRTAASFVRRGEMEWSQELKQWDFMPDHNLQPVNEYPHDQTGDLGGCIQMLQPPHIDADGKTPPGMYQIVVDTVYKDKDEAEDLTSLYAIYVVKQPNPYDNMYSKLPVAWYIGRPQRLDDAHERAVALAEFYNCTIQGEIAGGGKDLVGYCRRRHKLHLLDGEPQITSNRDYQVEGKNKSYLMNMSTDVKELGLTYLIEWVTEPRGLDDQGNLVTNLDQIFDLGLLRELRKFNGKRNADRISALIIAMFMLKENVHKQVETQKATGKTFYERSFFGEATYQEDSGGTIGFY